MVESSLNYLAAMQERPVYYTYEPPPGTSWRNTRGDRRSVPIRDARALAPPPSLDLEGFALARHETAVEDFDDGSAVRRSYYPEIEGLVQDFTGASRVLAFDHNVRRADRAEDGIRGPVHYVHNDYTEGSGPQRVRDLLDGDEAEVRLRSRVAVINVWKPIGRPVHSMPLAICDASSIEPDDLVPTDLRYPDRTGEIYSVTFNPGHRWFYFPEMQTDEALLLVCYDSSGDRGRFTAHSAFDDPTSRPDAPARQSVEVRTLVFF